MLHRYQSLIDDQVREIFESSYQRALEKTSDNKDRHRRLHVLRLLQEVYMWQRIGSTHEQDKQRSEQEVRVLASREARCMSLLFQLLHLDSDQYIVRFLGFCSSSVFYKATLLTGMLVAHLLGQPWCMDGNSSLQSKMRRAAWSSFRYWQLKG